MASGICRESVNEGNKVVLVSSYGLFNGDVICLYSFIQPDKHYIQSLPQHQCLSYNTTTGIIYIYIYIVGSMAMFQ